MKLEEGTYTIPEECCCDYDFKTHTVIIRKSQKKLSTGRRCKDCIHWKIGPCSRFNNADTICELMPKTVDFGKDVTGKGFYYQRKPYNQACDKFEEIKIQKRHEPYT